MAFEERGVAFANVFLVSWGTAVTVPESLLRVTRDVEAEVRCLPLPEVTAAVFEWILTGSSRDNISERVEDV